MAYLSDNMIQPLRFGDEVSCKISACVAADCDNTKGPARESNKLVAEVKV